MTAPWLLKQEMRRGGSALLRIADEMRSAGGSCAGGRSRRVFAAHFGGDRGGAADSRDSRRSDAAGRYICPKPRRCEVLTIVATGPLTSDALSREIERLTGAGHLAFYDSISPIVDAESIDMSRVYFAARWDKGTADYINCPMDRAGVRPVLRCAGRGGSRREQGMGEAGIFRGLPADRGAGPRGRDTLRFGPMKPVGLRDPRTGKNAVGRGAVAQGESARRQLQPGRFSESPEVWRAGAGAAADSGT